MVFDLGSRSMDEKTDDTVIRKGPWKAEEDEVLINHVRRYGPRDWSSIRSKGLLQRSGKSCRLRWVNKLRPNLKRFTMEEERIVIELQAQLGNKWARIATFLPGRTDNDVKNFWSSRQKRLARVLPSKQQLKTNNEVSVSTLKVSTSTMKEEESASKGQPSSTSSQIETTETIKMVQLLDLVKPKLPSDNCEANILDQIDYPPIKRDQIPQPQTDPSFFIESQEIIPRLEDPYFMDVFGRSDSSEFDHGAQLSLTPDTFFDDFPTDMFDHIDPLPNLSDW